MASNKIRTSTGWLAKTGKSAIKGLMKIGGIGGSAGRAMAKPMMEYKRKMEKQYEATPAGKKLMDNIKKEGFLKSLKKTKTGEL